MIDFKITTSIIKQYFKNPFLFITNNVDDEATCLSFLTNYLRINVIFQLIGEAVETYLKLNRMPANLTVINFFDIYSIDLISGALTFIFSRYLALLSIYLGTKFLRFIVLQTLPNFDRLAAIRLLTYTSIVFIIPTIGYLPYDVILIILQSALYLPLIIVGFTKQFKTSYKNGTIIVFTLAFIGILIALGLWGLTFLINKA